MLGGKMFICTLTSWRARINIVANTIRSLLENTFKPDKIVLNLSKEEFPRMDEELPQNLINLSLHNPVEIYWVEGNARAFKKLIPTLDRYRDAIVMTNDDDIIYPKDFLEEVTSHYDFTNPMTLNGGKNWGSGYGSMYEFKHFGKYLHAFDRREVWNTNEDDIAYGVQMLLNGYKFAHYGYNFRKIQQVDEAHGMCANGWYNSNRNELWFENYIRRRYCIDYKWLRDCIDKGIRFELVDREPITNDTILQVHINKTIEIPQVVVPAPVQEPVREPEPVVVQEPVMEPAPEKITLQERRDVKKERFLKEVKHIVAESGNKRFKKFIR